MKKSMRDKIAERFNQIQRDRKYDEDKHTDKDLYPLQEGYTPDRS